MEGNLKLRLTPLYYYTYIIPRELGLDTLYFLEYQCILLNAWLFCSYNKNDNINS